MEFLSMVDHESIVGVDIVKTTYKCSLPFWSALSKHYTESFISPYFDMAEGENYQCRLQISVPEVVIYFTGTRPLWHSICATLSIVDESMEKLLTVSSNLITESVAVFPFPPNAKAVEPYLQSDTLILYLEIWIVKALNNKQSSLVSNITNRRVLNRINYEQRFNEKLFCDVTFVVKGVKLTAHRLILSENSDVFKAMFTTNMQEKQEGLVRIEDVDAEVFEMFLKFMYTGRVENIDRIVTDIISLAHKYQVMDLIGICETYMKGHLSADNVTAYLLIAHQMGCKSLEDAAVIFLKRNTQILVDPDEYKLLFDCPALLKRIFGKPTKSLQ